MLKWHIDDVTYDLRFLERCFINNKLNCSLYLNLEMNKKITIFPASLKLVFTIVAFNQLKRSHEVYTAGFCV